ncbi:GNVR domain-containing protein [Aminobacter sp. Piv2-1]|uniref:GNVR domain-containing protein n=1 Tax=Aminobacter sp. Piv2-1 TaxID=3031122 RepID=UPI0030A0A9A7
MDNRLTSGWPQATDPHDAGEREFISFADIWAFLKQYARIIAGSVAAAVFCAWFYLATTDPVYTAMTQILIEPKIPQVLQQQQTEVNLTLDTAQVESHIAVMRSEKIASIVIKELGLQDDAAFRAPPPTILGRFAKLGRMAANRIGLDGEWLFGGSSDQAGTSTQLTDFERERLTMWAFSDNLDVRRVGVSYAIAIAFQSPDPETAAKVANATADVFVREQLETKAAAAREGGSWLEERLNQLRAQMNEATQIAQEFRAKHDYDVVPRPDGSDGSAGASAPTLEELEVTADTYRKMYESFLQAYTNSVSQQSYPVADARVITEATRPLVPSAPRRKLTLAFGALAGLIFGVAAAFLRHMLDRTVRSPKQLREEFGLECLGELPVLSGRGASGTLDAVALTPSSAYANSLRHVKTAIGLADSARSLHCIGIVSALPSDGKSTFASNLAMLYSMCGTRTLVVDADIFHSVLSRYLLPQPATAAPGAVGSGPIEQHIMLTKNATFDMLPSHVVDARGLLGPRNMRILMPELQAYDFVVVDLPPLTSGTDRLATAALFDGVIVVAEWGRTPVDLFGELVRSLHASKASIIGVLLTNARSGSTATYGRGFDNAR